MKAKKKDRDEALNILQELFDKAKKTKVLQEAAKKHLAEKRSSGREIILRVVGEKKNLK